jgi:hypothetical protein
LIAEIASSMLIAFYIHPAFNLPPIFYMISGIWDAINPDANDSAIYLTLQSTAR